MNQVYNNSILLLLILISNLYSFKLVSGEYSSPVQMPFDYCEGFNGEYIDVSSVILSKKAERNETVKLTITGTVEKAMQFGNVNLTVYGSKEICGKIDSTS